MRGGKRRDHTSPRSAPERQTGARSHGPAVAVILTALACSHVAVRSAGVRFNQPIGGYWQYADPELLRHDLARTLWYFHAQPPGFNAFLGAVVRLPHGWQTPAFRCVFLVCSLATVLGIYALATMLGVPRWPAVAIALAFGLSPSAVIYENLLFYPAPVAAMLCVMFVALTRYLRTSSIGWGGLLFATAAALVLTRATFHLLWLFGIVVVALLARPTIRRRTLALAALPLIVASGLYVKNFILFDTLSSSSWAGMNLAIVVRATPKVGTLTGLLKTSPFQPPSVYGANDRPPTGIAVLDDQRKRRGGTNYNYIGYVDVGSRYLRADLAYIGDHPVLYARAAAKGVQFYFAPAETAQGGNELNFERIGTFARLYDRVIGWQPRQFTYAEANERRRLLNPPDASHIAWSMVLLYALALATLPAVAWRVRRRPPRAAVNAWVLATASATIWFSTLTDNAMDIGENARFRFETDPIAWVLGAVVVTQIVHGALHFWIPGSSIASGSARAAPDLPNRTMCSAG